MEGSLNTSGLRVKKKKDSFNYFSVLIKKREGKKLIMRRSGFWAVKRSVRNINNKHT